MLKQALIVLGILLVFGCADVPTGNEQFASGCSEGSDSSTENVYLPPSNPETFAWSGTNQLGSSLDDKATDIAISTNGEIYLVGYTYGGIDGYTNAGGEDFFVAKYDSNGKKLWLRQSGTVLDDRATSVAMDGQSKNLYISGNTRGELDGNTNDGGNDVFITKYNAYGLKLWTKQLGFNGTESVTSIASDSNENVYVTGCTTQILEENELGLILTGSQDSFVVKLDSAGTLKWKYTFGSSISDDSGRTTYYNDCTTGIVVDSNENIYVTGTTDGPLNGSIHFGQNDMFLTKFDKDIGTQWTQQVGSAMGDSGQDLTLGDNGNIFVCGQTNAALDGNIFGGYYDFFVTRFDEDGNKIWTRQLGTGNTTAIGVTTDKQGDIYLTGSTTGGLDGNSSAGSEDLFLVKYNSDGVKQWTRQLGTSGADYGSSLATDHTGNVYVTGYTSGSLEENTNAGGYDIFIVKYDSNGNKQ